MADIGGIIRCVKFHVDQIETHVRQLYEEEYWDPSLDENANRSRLLAHHAVALALSGADQDDPWIEITDGGEDRGIDAIGVDLDAKVIVLVQSKWREDGSGSMALGDVLKFLAGVRSLLGMAGDDEPVHASQKAKAAVRDLLRTPGAHVTLVTATTAKDSLSEEVEQPIVELLGSVNDVDGVEPLASHLHFGQGDFFNSISAQHSVTVDIDLQMRDWGKGSEPHTMYYGRVGASEIAEWYERDGENLFADNIRVMIPNSDINQGILGTVRDEPENFLYFNNGITVLAKQIELGPGGTVNREVGFFKLTDASVVNGAQTVSTLGNAKQLGLVENLGAASVLVRCIEVPESSQDLDMRITRFANTQNEVSSQDFAFLDSEQHRLVRELEVLGIEYILRSGQARRSVEGSIVIDVRQAAIALACASSNVAHAITAKREVSRLFADRTLYATLFNPTTDPLRLSHAAAITAVIDDTLGRLAGERDGLESGIATHGGRVIAHLIMRDFGDEWLADSASSVRDAESDIAEQVEQWVVAFAREFPDNSYPGNVFKNQGRVNELIESAKSNSQD